MKGMNRPKEWQETSMKIFKEEKSHEFSVVIQKIAKELDVNDVIDFGCGEGLLSTAFSKEAYLGVDICEKVIAKASKTFASYAFTQSCGQVFSTDMCIASKVLSKLNDSDINKMLSRMRCKWLLVAENLPERKETENITSINYRGIENYVNIMRIHDLLLMKKSVSQDQNGKNVSFLLFKKCIKNPMG